jgi:nicotinamide mononucleotide adenylyltransferase
MIRNSLIECGISADRFCIIPFDFENLETINNYAPPSPLVMMTITDKWSEEKQSKIEAIGKQVEILFTDIDPVITGTLIRSLINSCDSSWHTLVPPAVVRIITKINGCA